METKEKNGSATTIITDQAGMPNNVDAERAVLSQCFHSAEHLVKVLDAGITRLDFHNTDHRVVFEAIQRLHQGGDIVDQVTVCDRVWRRKALFRFCRCQGRVSPDGLESKHTGRRGVCSV